MPYIKEKDMRDIKTFFLNSKLLFFNFLNIKKAKKLETKNRTIYTNLTI